MSKKQQQTKIKDIQEEFTMMNTVNPAGPRFEHRTDNIIGRGMENGRIDGKEAGILRRQDNAIHNRVGFDKANGLDPRTDPVLAHMQQNHRGAAMDFTHNQFNANDSVSLSPQAQQELQGQNGIPGKGPHSFTDENGNQVTRTPDGYTYMENTDGTTTTLTPGGYAIDYDKDNSQLTFTDSKSGESTTIWGDPHVSESDESGNFWNFDSATNSFVLPDGTKITCDATAADGTLTGVNIYSGQGRTHISNTISDGNSLTGDARRADYAQDDGTTYFSNLKANDWYTGSPWGEEMQTTNTGYEGLPYYA